MPEDIMVKGVKGLRNMEKAKDSAVRVVDFSG